MTPIIPEALQKRAFTRTDGGYNTEEVDHYIRRLTENYILLYKENASLLQQLNALGAKPQSPEEAQEQSALILKNAQAQSDKMIEEAYLRADSILASVQMNCDSILRGFKEKVEAQERTLSEMKKNILKFKNGLLEHYRLHMEWIENLFPVDDEETDLTPEAYATHIVEELKRKFSDQYEIFPETQMELCVPTEFRKKTDPEKQTVCPRTSARKKIVKKTPVVMDLIDEHENTALKCDAHSADTQQFMLDFDHSSEDGVTIDKHQ